MADAPALLKETKLSMIDSSFKTPFCIPFLIRLYSDVSILIATKSFVILFTPE